ncbi:MerR family transcriptional regulator [Actinomycetospora termitidis]|nr:MerR family transcriptional regulator [Actinomycetospora sp. Odt1-22]
MTIGEFAVAVGLTPKALRLYDELGLVVPAAVDGSSGYRFYDRAQRDRARLVATLRRVGVPLARIAVVVDLPADEAIADLEAWWRQVEHDTATRRALVADLLTRWGRSTIMTTGAVQCLGATGLVQGGRDTQQDAVAWSAGRAVVADGFHDGGADASRVAVDAVLAADVAEPVEALRSAFAAAAREVGPTDAGGTTATALWCDGARVGLAHLGDSRAYLLRDGVLTQVTNDHSQVRSLVDEGRLTPEEARDHPERPRLVRALGTDEPDVHLRTARAGDRYLLCTDGVWCLLDDAALARTLAAGAEPGPVVGNLLEQVRAAGAPDNAACAVVDLVAE